MNPEQDPFVRRREQLGEEHIKAWERTLEEAKLIAEDRRADGWESEVVMAAHTDTVSKDMKDHDRFGLIHVIPNNYTDTLRDVYDETEFTEDLVYGSAIQGVMYVAIELIDSDTDRSLVIPCSYDMTQAQGMSQCAAEEGALYSYFKTITGEILGRFRHEDVESLVTPPNA